jgi:copper chaperone for superoxide dismutase
MHATTTARLAFKCSLLLGAVMAARIRAQPTVAHAHIGLHAPDSGFPAVVHSPLTTVELAVKMHCESCVEDVRTVLQALPGVENVYIDLSTETAWVKGSARPADLAQALALAGRDARIIGIGDAAKIVPSEVGLAEEWGAAVGEYKGHLYGHGTVVGVIRLVQTSPEQLLVDAHITGLERTTNYALRVHEFGDLRQVPRTCGRQLAKLAEGKSTENGDLIVRSEATLKVWELIGRAIIIYQEQEPLVGTVIARSAGVGGNSGKRQCSCDGTVIWEAKY